MKEHSYGVAPYKIINNKVYLFVNKASKESLNGFFKGKIEINESIKECAKRELFEESNLLIDINDLEHYFFQNSIRKNIGIFLIDSYNIDFKTLKINEEIFSTEWIELNELCLSILGNQSKILDDMILHFKSLNKYYLKNKFK